MSNRMWGGRFASGPDAIMEEINASIDFDKRLAGQDIRGSLAHVAMLAETGIVTKADASAIETGLKSIRDETEAGESRDTVADVQRPRDERVVTVSPSVELASGTTSVEHCDELVAVTLEDRDG